MPPAQALVTAASIQELFPPRKAPNARGNHQEVEAQSSLGGTGHLTGSPARFGSGANRQQWRGEFQTC
jgi:hypothetical protein